MARLVFLDRGVRFFEREGEYYLDCSVSGGSVCSFPFHVQDLILERNTLSGVTYYFKDERSSGRLDQADRHLRFDGRKQGTLDAHGGWWDATGDYGKHLSHLSFSTYFNPQQIPLVVYSLMKSYEQLRFPNLFATRIACLTRLISEPCASVFARILVEVMGKKRASAGNKKR